MVHDRRGQECRPGLRVAFQKNDRHYNSVILQADGDRLVVLGPLEDFELSGSEVEVVGG